MNRSRIVVLGLTCSTVIAACGGQKSADRTTAPTTTAATTAPATTPGPPPLPQTTPKDSIIAKLAERLGDAGYPIKHFPNIDSDFSAVVKAGDLQVWAYSQLREAVRVTKQYNSPQFAAGGGILVRRVHKHVYMLLRPGQPVTAEQRAEFFRILRAGEGKQATPTTR